MNTGALSAALIIAVCKSLIAQLSLELQDEPPLNFALKSSKIDHDDSDWPAIVWISELKAFAAKGGIAPGEP
ncbi:hypothetical protein RvVAR031_pl06920 (plasmid) [Agrobacterium vitis]|nr:hypothetical protein RvVAR031_pl06920 [Agrobacterium vitis]